MKIIHAYFTNNLFFNIVEIFAFVYIPHYNIIASINMDQFKLELNDADNMTKETDACLKRKNSDVDICDSVASSVSKKEKP